MTPHPSSNYDSNTPSRGLMHRLRALDQVRLRYLALRVAAVEGVFATAWVLGSDRIARALFDRPEQLLRWRTDAAAEFLCAAVVLGLVSSVWLALRGAGYEGASEKTREGQTHGRSSMAFPAAEAVVVVDDTLRVTAFNTAAEQMFLCPGERAVGHQLGRFVIGGLDSPVGGLMTLLGVREGKGTFSIEVSVSDIGSKPGSLRMLIVRDIAQRVAHEREVERLKRLYAALSQINQAIVWTPKREELFEKICKVLADYGGFQMAWIGWHDPVSSLIRPVASSGDENDYLQSIAVYADNRPEGCGPVGVAFRENRSCIINDLTSDPSFAPFLAQASQRGFQSSAVFPIQMKGKACGTLAVYANERAFFQEKEIALLSEAAFDISFALDGIASAEERKHAEAVARNEKLFSDTILDSLPGIVYFYNEDGKFLRWNRNFEEVSGYTGEEIARMHPIDFFASEDHGTLAERITEVFENGESSLTVPFRARNGTRTLHYFTGRRLEFQGMRCLVGVGIDISEQKRAETALRELASTLEHRVADRTAELQMALVRAEAADRLKSAFLATMSHELRTPLNSIIGFTGIVLRGLAGPLNVEQTKQLSMVRASARHLLELINDVLDLSKIEAGQLKVQREPFDLPPVVERAVELVRPLAEKKGLALSFSLDPSLGAMVGDRRRVEQILLNLVNNAVKFTPSGSVVLSAERLSAHCRTPGSTPEDVVCLRVSDTGIGIKPEDMGTLFKPFQQLDTGLSREHEGTGLGLAICHRLAHLLGGEISAESHWGKGSVFTVVLPLNQPE